MKNYTLTYGGRILSFIRKNAEQYDAVYINKEALKLLINDSNLYTQILNMPYYIYDDVANNSFLKNDHTIVIHGNETYKIISWKNSEWYKEYKKWKKFE